MSEERPAEGIERRWYWDRRNHKACFPCKVDDGTVHFVSIWHEDEVGGALANDALVPIEEFRRLNSIGSFRENLPEDVQERTGDQNVFDFVESFRILPDSELDPYCGDE